MGGKRKIVVKSGSGMKYVRHSEAPADAPPVAARAGDLVFVGGAMPVHPLTGVPAETLLHPGMPHHGSLIEKQLRYLYTDLDRHLVELGTSLNEILKISAFHRYSEDLDMALRVRRDWFNPHKPPPSSALTVPELAARGARVMIDMINLADDATFPLTVVNISNAPPISQVKAIGWAVYSQIVKGGGFVFTRGTTATDEHGPLSEIMPDHPFPYRYDQAQFQIRAELDRLVDLLKDAGCTMNDVVKAEIHLKYMTDISAVDEVWKEYFPVDPPARVVTPLALPVPPMRVKTELIAIDPEGPYRKETIQTDRAPTPHGPEPQAVKAGPYVFLSGQMATDYENGLAPEARVNSNFPFHDSSAKLQAEYILKNVEALCEAAGTSSANLVRRRVQLADLADIPRAEAVWRARLGERIPPTSTFRTSGPMPVPDCTIQYDLIAYDPL